VICSRQVLRLVTLKRRAVIQKAFVFVADRTIATARSSLQAFAILYRDGSPHVMDVSGLLKHRGSNRNSRPVYAKHLREKFLG